MSQLRFKVSQQAKGPRREGWWWRCYTEDCAVQYYQPERRVAILRTGERVSYGELIRHSPRRFIAIGAITFRVR